MKSLIFPIDALTPSQQEDIAARLDAGAVAVFATDTVYGIGTGAFNEASVQKIYQIKQRPAASPLQLLIGTVVQAKQIVQWNEPAEKLAAAFWPGALTLILKPNAKGQPLRRGFAGLGLRVPAYPALTHLLTRMQTPLCSTSANLHGRPVITTQEEVISFFDGKAELILTGGTLSPVASSVLDLTAEPTLLREGALTQAELERVSAISCKKV